MNSLGERIYKLRTEKGMSQGDLADSLDVSRQTVSKWENNQSIPELDRIIAMSDAFSVSVDYIVKGESLKSEQKEETETVSVEDFSAGNAAKVNSKNKYISLIAASVSLIYIVYLLSDAWTQISNIINGYASADDFELIIISTVPMLFSAIALLCVNIKLVSISYSIILSAIAIPFALGVLFAGKVGIARIFEEVEIIDFVILIAYTIIAYMGFRGNKKNIKQLCIIACMLFIACEAIRLVESVYSFYTEMNYTPWDTFLSVLSQRVGKLPKRLFEFGVCAVMYLKINSKPDSEMSAHTANDKKQHT